MGNGGSAYQNRLAKYAYARNRNQKVLPSVEAEATYGKLLLIASGADGKISEKERRWVVESRAALGVPGNVISALQKYNPTKQEMDDFLVKEKDFIDPLKRVLIFDACEMAASDGSFSANERKTIDAFAKRIGVENGTVEHIIKSFDEDRAAKKKMTALLFPYGVDTAIQSAVDEKAKKVGRAS